MTAPLFAVVSELRRDRNDRPFWEPVGWLEPERKGGAGYLLAGWLADRDPGAGTYKIDTSWGASAEMAHTEGNA